MQPWLSKRKRVNTMSHNVYIKVQRSTDLKKPKVTLEDVASVYCIDPEIIYQIKQIFKEILNKNCRANQR